MLSLRNEAEDLTFNCEIVGYQFPSISDPIDANWCLLKIRLTQGERQFTKIDAALETREIINIYEWFNSLSEQRLPSYSELNFTEPCISFSFLSNKNEIIRISINLSHELKPNFPLTQFGHTNDEWAMVFNLTREDFEKNILTMRNAIISYPVKFSVNK